MRIKPQIIWITLAVFFLTMLVGPLVFAQDSDLTAEIKAAQAKAQEIIQKAKADAQPQPAPQPEPQTEPLPEPPQPAPAPEPEDASPRRVAVSWTADRVQAPPPILTTYLVSEPWCKYCPAKERELKRNGISFTKINTAKAREMGEDLSRGIPHVFTREVQQSAPEAPVTAELDTDSTADLAAAAIPILIQHLEHQSQVDPNANLTGGMFDIDVDLPELYPDILSSLFIKQEWSSEKLNLSLQWQGKQQITSSSGVLTFSPPVKIQKAVGIFSVKVTLETITIQDNGRRLLLGLGGSPDLTITIKPTPATSAVKIRDHPADHQSLFYRESYPPRWKPLDGSWGTHPTKEQILSHLRNGREHTAKAWQGWPLDSLTVGQLSALHDDDHEGKVVIRD